MMSFPDRDVPKMAYWKSVIYEGVIMEGNDQILWFCPVCDKVVTRFMDAIYERNEMPPDGASFCKHCGQRLEYPVGDRREAHRGTHVVKVTFGKI